MNGVKKREGMNRQYWNIRQFLDAHGLTMKSIAQRVGVSSEQARKTIRGQDNSQRVLVGLIEAGCPIEYLDLPEKMKMKAVM